MRNHSFSYAFSVAVLLFWGVEAFVQQSRPSYPTCERSSLPQVLRATANDESATKEVEKALRQEIVDRNSKVEDEGKYAVVDGSGMDTEKEKPSSSTTEATEESSSSISEEVKKLERLIKKRPYPLFLAEKGVEIIEDTVDGLFGKDKKEAASSSSTPPNGEREKIVILGTGWGAAAFLKGIDTRLFDVTVISPRNYFLFTPMLAGASVGTVDYRSITQPIREVRRTSLGRIRYRVHCAFMFRKLMLQLDSSKINEQ